MSPTIPESHRDLLQARFATLATIAPDGRPQLTEVWFIADGETVQVSLNTARQKVANLQKVPYVTMLILDLANPLRYVEIRADAELRPDDEYECAGRVGAKYGADLRAFDGPGETRIQLTLRPTRVVAVDLSA